MIGENNNNSDYEYFELDEPVREINGELYTTVQGISRGCNIVFNYYNISKFYLLCNYLCQLKIIFVI